MMGTVIRRFTRNTVGRDFVVGDIHGAFGKLGQALNAIGFNSDRDRLFSVGDLVDRGPESHHYDTWLAYPWFHAIRGNHEEMAIQYAAGNLDIELYLANGGLWNVAQSPAAQLAAALEFSQLPIVIEVETATGTIGIVHADVPGSSWSQFLAQLADDNPDREEIIQYALWSRCRLQDRNDDGVQNMRAVIVGHSVQNVPLTLGNVIYIDTGGWMGVAGGAREFTILDLSTLKPATREGS